jgi:hypothetical protein
LKKSEILKFEVSVSRKESPADPVLSNRDIENEVRNTLRENLWELIRLNSVKPIYDED